MQVYLVVINLDVNSTYRNEIQSILSSAEKDALSDNSLLNHVAGGQRA
jgi:hypothetical protein